MAHAFVGRWRITDMELWGPDAVDLETEGHFTFEPADRYGHATGSFHFICVQGYMDCRFSKRGKTPRVEFSWDGVDETDQACGRGWAEIRRGKLVGRIFIHLADDSSFEAEGGAEA